MTDGRRRARLPSLFCGTNCDAVGFCTLIVALRGRELPPDAAETEHSKITFMTEHASCGRPFSLVRPERRRTDVPDRNFPARPKVLATFRTH